VGGIQGRRRGHVLAMNLVRGSVLFVKELLLALSLLHELHILSWDRTAEPDIDLDLRGQRVCWCNGRSHLVVMLWFVVGVVL